MRFLQGCVLFITITVSISANADLKESFVDINLGMPFSAEIENSDGTTAHYNGYGVLAKFNYNLAGGRSGTRIGYLGDFLGNVSMGLVAQYKKMDLKNTKKAPLSEIADHSGYGLGLYLQMGDLYLAGTHNLMSAKHITTGAVHATSEYDYSATSIEAALLIPYGNTLQIGPAYTYTQTDLPKDEVGTSEDAPYNEQIIWLKLVIYFDKQ